MGVTTAEGGGGDNVHVNLMAEMVRRGISVADIGRVIRKTERSVRDKIAGRYPFTLNEAKEIRDTFFEGMDLDFLFASPEDL